MHPRIFILDNYDSFTYNLVHLVESIFHTRVKVCYNDQVDWIALDASDKIILSPGPGLPDEAGCMKEVIQKYAPLKPILGVCLGHQAIAEVFGAQLQNLQSVCHGVSMPMNIVEQDDLYHSMDQHQRVGRYHSWVVDSTSLPEEFIITAVDEEKHIMSMRHRQYPLTGIQFHPESILTPNGYNMLENWLSA